jgi:hypothetical protein
MANINKKWMLYGDRVELKGGIKNNKMTNVKYTVSVKCIQVQNLSETAQLKIYGNIEIKLDGLQR